MTAETMQTIAGYMGIFLMMAISFTLYKINQVTSNKHHHSAI